MSEEEQFDLFCTHCGKRLTKDATFCPSCGAQVSDMMGGSSAPSYGSPYQPDMSGRLGVITVILFISAVLSILVALALLLSADVLVDIMQEDKDYWEALCKLTKMDSGELSDFFRERMKISGITILASGVFIAVAGYCGSVKRKWVVGFISCIIATVLAMSIIGAIVTVLYYTTKTAFKD